MSLKIKISEELKSAMKEKNTSKLSILRVLKSEIERNEQTSAGKIDLPDGDVIKLVKKLVEGIKETTNNTEELTILEGYLPSQLGEDVIREIVGKLKDGGYSSIGEYMKFFKITHDGSYDGKVLNSIVREIL